MAAGMLVLHTDCDFVGPLIAWLLGCVVILSLLFHSCGPSICLLNYVGVTVEGTVLLYEVS